MEDGNCELERERRIDAVCDLFERQLAAGQPPAVDDFLRQVPRGDRSQLAIELLRVAVSYAKRQSPDSVLGSTHGAVDGQTEKPPLPVVESGSCAIRIGDYELLEELGTGGMGAVYKARQLGVNRVVALKILRPDRWRGLTEEQRSRAIERFIVESQAAARRDHPHVVTVYDAGQHEGIYYLAMQFVPGESLSAKICSGPLDDNAAAKYLEPVCRALHAVHAAGIIHRDIKPSNLLVDDQSEQVLISDFGLAKLTDREQDLTLSGDLFGTPSFMSPEQVVSSGQVTVASDVYGIGATLYNLITARPPFQASTVPGVVHQVLAFEPVAPHLLNPAVSRDLETITLKCLEKDPSWRYPSALAVALELQKFLAGQPIEARPVRWYERLSRWAKRNRAIAAMAGLLAATTVSASLVFALLIALHASAESKYSRQQRDVMVRDAELTKPKPQSLPYLLEAIKLDRDHSAQTVADRIRLAHVWRNCHQPIGLWFHDASVQAVGLSSSGNLAFSLTADSQIHVYRTADNATVATFGPTGSPLVHAAFNPEESLLAASCANGSLLVTSLSTGELILEKSLHRRAIRRLAFSPDGQLLATACLDHTVGLWQVNDDCSAIRQLRHPKDVLDVAFSDDGARLVTSSVDGVVRVWDVESGDMLHRLRHSSSVVAGAFRPGSTDILSFDGVTAARLWRVGESGVAYWTAFSQDEGVYRAAFADDGDRLITCTKSGQIQVWDPDRETRVGKPLEHGGPIAALKTSGSFFVSLGVDGSLLHWSLDTLEPVAAQIAPGTGVVTTDLNAEGTGLLLGGRDGITRLLAMPELGKTLIAARGDVRSGDFNFWAGANHFVGSQGTSLHVVNVPAGTSRVLERSQPIMSAVISDLELSAIVTSADGSIHRWNLVTGALESEPTQNLSTVQRVIFGLNGGNYVGSDAAQKALNVEEADRATVSLGSKPLGIACHPSTSLVATRDENRVTIWSAADVRIEQLAVIDCGPIVTATFSDDGTSLVTVGTDATVTLWEPCRGKLLGQPLRLESVPITATPFQKSGRLLIVDRQGRAQIVDVLSGRTTHTLSHSSARITAGAVNCEGTLIATLSDGSLSLSDASSGELLAFQGSQKTPITKLIWHPKDASLLACRYRDGSVRSFSFTADSRSLDQIEQDLLLVCSPADWPKHLDPPKHSIQQAWHAYRARNQARLTLIGHAP